MNQTVKIRDLTGTEQTYSNIPYIKVKDSNAAEHIFVNTSDANILASDVSIGKTAYGADGSLIQGAYEGEGGGGISINGTINSYIVYAGQSINAGDFVSFVNTTHVKKDLVTPQGIAANSGTAGDIINCYTPPV
jgi:hypothetical protein